MKRNIIIALGTILLPAGGNMAQTGLQECAAISDDDARLACYDRHLEAASPASREKLPVFRLPGTGDSETARPPAEDAEDSAGETARSDNFGLEDKGQADDGTRTFQVKAARHNQFTGWTIEFENGQIWRQVGTENYTIREGERYTIQRAMFNSFLLGSDRNNRKIRVTRIE